MCASFLLQTDKDEVMVRLHTVPAFMFELRDYQKDALKTIWEALCKNQKALCVLPTGAGKTVIFKEFLKKAHEASPNLKSVVLLNRETLVEQTARVLGQDVGVYCAGVGQKDLSKPITVASIQSINKIHLENVGLCIVDECHNLSDTYETFIENLGPKVKLLGFSATPFNEQGVIFGSGKFWPERSFYRSLKFMIDAGYLVRPILSRGECAFDTSKLAVRMGDYRKEDIELLTGDEKKVISQIKDAMPRIENRKKIIWVCSSIKHAELLQKKIPEASSILHSKLSSAEKELNKKAFEDGFFRHMISVAMLSEGYDYPPVDTIILMRPTRSPRMYVQVVGRGLRLSEGKKDCLVIDYGEVVKNLGPLDNPVILSKVGSKKLDPLETPLKSCPECLSYIDKLLSECQECHYEFSKEEMDVVSKNTRTKAQDGVLLSGPEIIEKHDVKDVTLKHHTAKATGNKCIRIDFYTSNTLWPIAKFVGAWPKSWFEGQKILSQMGLDFSSFEEGWQAIEEGWTKVDKVPSAILTKRVGKYDNIVGLEFGVQNRESDSDFSF